jgi:hypothetical protein
LAEFQDFPSPCFQCPDNRCEQCDAPRNEIRSIQMKHKWKISAAVVLALTFIPVPYLASPEWSILVVDENGNPLPGMLVRLEYQNFSVEQDAHEEDRTTDEHGQATFPSHKLSASILRRCYYTVKSALALAHASFGPNAYVLAFGDHLEGDATSGSS